MKLAQIVNSQAGLNKLVKLDMDIKKSYALRKFIVACNTHIVPFNEVRNELIRKNGEEKDGNMTVTDPDKLKMVLEELNKMGEEEIEIDIPEIGIDDIEGKIDTETLITLEYLIK